MKCISGLVIILALSSQATTDLAQGGQPLPSKENSSSAVTCAPRKASSPEATKILFVGNSLTYANDLPSLVSAKGMQDGRLIENEVLAFPNFALEDHWNDGCIQLMINSGFFDFVVVQQGPSSQTEGRSMLLEYGEKIQQLCKKNNTKLAFYMVWPARVNYQTFQGVINSYTEAATTTGAALCPAGLVWKNHFDLTGDFTYYGPDGFHPSLKGSEVAADAIYKTLFP